MSLESVGIVSENPKKSIEFYGHLGVEIKQFENSGHYEGMSSSGIKIMLDTVELIRSFDPDWKKSVGSGLVLCFKQDSPKKLDQVYEQITRAGFKSVKAPWDAFWGQRYACVADPDGNRVDLFASL